jgi:GNAT superfamily N-acetyltransferase
MHIRRARCEDLRVELWAHFEDQARLQRVLGGLTVHVRRARPQDAERLTELAYAAKRHWNYPEPWIELWRADLTVTASFVRGHPVYCAVVDRRVIGFYALSRRRGEFELEHMWVQPEYMGHGVGKRLFAHAVETARAAGGTLLRIAADPNAVDFYRRMGAHRVGAVPSTPEGRQLPLLVVELRGSSQAHRAPRKGSRRASP